ncbi:MAG TPA: phosphorylase [Methylovirgula sp.]
MLAVTGLIAEARVAAGPHIAVVSCGGDRTSLEAKLESALRADVSAIVSFGIAGGLAPGVRAGTPLVARAVIAEDGSCFESDRAWAQDLANALGGAPIVDIAGVDRAVVDPAQKRALHVATGAIAVDMESHIAARVAAAHNLPFVAFRVVADPAERRLPPAALVALRDDGTLALGAVMRSLLRQPRQVPHLIRTALDTKAAFESLFRGRKMIAGGFGFGDFRELVLDVPCEDVLGRSLPV